MRRLAFTALLLVVLCGISRSAAAQSPADSASLARATAEAVDSALGRETPGSSTPIVLVRAVTPFDSAVARHLHQTPAFQQPVADTVHALRVDVGGFELHGDTAEVLVELSHCGTGMGMNWWVNRFSYLFARAAGGWRLQYPPRMIDAADGHCGPPRERVPVAKDGG
jgi:hypothetical protein